MNDSIELKPDDYNEVNEIIKQVENIIVSEKFTNSDKGKLLITIKSDVIQKLLIIDKFKHNGIENKILLSKFGESENARLFDIWGYEENYEKLLKVNLKIELFLFSITIEDGKENIQSLKIDEENTTLSVKQINILIKALEESETIPKHLGKDIALSFGLIFNRSTHTIRQNLKPIHLSNQSDLKHVLNLLKIAIASIEKNIDGCKKYKT